MMSPVIMVKENMMIEEIKNYLENYENILFAILFGSYASGKINSKSDLDIGIYFNQKINLLKLGKIITDLEKITALKIDLIELNNLYNKSPLLAYQITANHKVIFVRDETVLVNFKRMTLLNYLDTAELRKTVNAVFYNRISEKKFGKRNYA